MKNEKKSKILIGCLALLLVMAVGYALFSETITINGTATAKGDFDISFTCETLTSTNATAEETEGGILTKGGTGTCSIEGQTITTTSNLTKPTDVVVYRVKLTNEGSIPAVLKTVDSDNNCFDDSEFQKTCPGDETYFDSSKGLGAGYMLTILNEDGSVNTAAAYQGDAATEAAKITLQPGESMNAYIFHSWNDSGSLTQPVLPAEGASINYHVTLGFEQVQAQ